MTVSCQSDGIVGTPLALRSLGLCTIAQSELRATVAEEMPMQPTEPYVREDEHGVLRRGRHSRHA